MKQKEKEVVVRGMKHSEELGCAIPSHWDVKALGDVADITMGQSPDSQYYNTDGNGLPLIQGNADKKNNYSIVRIYTSSITKICNKNDILMSVRAPVGDIFKASTKSCIGRGICSFVYPNEYLYFYLQFIKNKWLSISQGTTFTAVNSNEIKTLFIPLPPVEEQEAIARVLGSADAVIDALAEQRATAEALKTMLMQQLLSGTRSALP